MQQEMRIVDGYVVTNKLLGEGSFGKVYRGYLEKDPKKLIAAKVLPLSQASKTKNFMKLLKREIDILNLVDSPYIVKMLHAARTANNYYIFLEFCNGADMRIHMKQRDGRLSEQEALTYFRHIINGFKGIYQENVMHRDIKPANILLHNGIAKISDFGFARIVESMEDAAQFSFVGTPLYMAPQILKQQPFSSKCDIWSLGIMFYEMLYGQTPWSANHQLVLLENIRNKPLNFPPLPKRSQAIKDLLTSMLVVEEVQRIEWHDLFEHPLIKQDQTIIQERISQIKDSNNDQLDKQAQLNQIYVDNNRVLPQGEENPFLTTQNSDEAEKAEQKEDYIKPNMTYNEIVNAQTNNIEEQNMINKIDINLRQRRNVGIFVNLVTNLVFTLQSTKVMNLRQSLFYRIMFILQKQQMIIFDEINNIMASKIPIGNGFTDKDWKIYKKSPQYFSFLKSIKTDIHFTKPYFNEIEKKTSIFIDQNINTLTANEQNDFKEFKQVMGQNTLKDLAFYAINKYTCQLVINQLKEEVANDPLKKKNKDVVLTHQYLLFCQDPYQHLMKKEYEDFNRFYEHYDNMDLEDIGKYIILVNQHLGKGNFSSVYKCVNKETPPTKFAVKITDIDILKKRLKIDFIKQTLQREVQAYRMLESPYIIKMYDSFCCQNEYFTILELCDSTLSDRIKKDGKLDENLALSYFYQLVEGYKKFQQNNLIHRDIKPDNIFIKDKNAKFGDLGLSRIMEDVDQQQQLTLVGTPHYCSPQILKSQQYSSKTDVWSLGITLFQMLYGTIPFKANSLIEQCDLIIKAKLQFPEGINVSENTKILISKMLQPEEINRISWDELFQVTQYKTKIALDQQERRMSITESGFLSQIDFIPIIQKVENCISMQRQKLKFIDYIQKQTQQMKPLYEKINISNYYETKLLLTMYQRQKLLEIKSVLINNQNSLEGFNIEELQIFKKDDKRWSEIKIKINQILTDQEKIFSEFMNSSHHKKFMNYPRYRKLYEWTMFTPELEQDLRVIINEVIEILKENTQTNELIFYFKCLYTLLKYEKISKDNERAEQVLNRLKTMQLDDILKI